MGSWTWVGLHGLGKDAGAGKDCRSWEWLLELGRAAWPGKVCQVRKGLLAKGRGGGTRKGVLDLKKDCGKVLGL